jgi:hypothetical protein
VLFFAITLLLLKYFKLISKITLTIFTILTFISLYNHFFKDQQSITSYFIAFLLFFIILITHINTYYFFHEPPDDDIIDLTGLNPDNPEELILLYHMLGLIEPEEPEEKPYRSFCGGKDSNEDWLYYRIFCDDDNNYNNYQT